MTGKLEKLNQRQARIEKQLARTKSTIADEERKRMTRAKILLGSLMIHDCLRDKELEKRIHQRLDEYLSRPADRAIFKLPSKEV